MFALAALFVCFFIDRVPYQNKREIRIHRSSPITTRVPALLFSFSPRSSVTFEPTTVCDSSINEYMVILDSLLGVYVAGTFLEMNGRV